MLKRKVTRFLFTVIVSNMLSTPMVVFADELQYTAEKGVNDKCARSELKELLNYADSINDIHAVRTDDYVEAKWDNFLYFREVVRQVLENRDSSEDEIKSAAWQIKYVIDQLGF